MAIEVGELQSQEQEIQPRRPDSIFGLPNYREQLPLGSPERERFDRILTVNLKRSPQNYNPGAREHIAAKFSTPVDDLDFRTVLTVEDLVLEESTNFSPMRARRPFPKPKEGYLDELAQKTAENCDFCNPDSTTPVDAWGTIKGDYCQTVSNGAPIDRFNSLVITKGIHDPRAITEDVFVEMMMVANQWFGKVYEYAKSQGIEDARYPYLFLNFLPRSGSSIFHPHIQMLMGERKPYPAVRTARRHTADYQYWNNVSFPNDYAALLEPLGMVKEIGQAKLMFDAAPRKEKGLMFYSHDSGNLPSSDLAKAIFRGIEFVRNPEIRGTSINVAVALPPFDEDLTRAGDWYNFRPLARLVERGQEGNTTADFAGFEVFGGQAAVASDQIALARIYDKIYSG